MIPSITVDELKNWLANDEAILVDVREPAEFEGAHIKEANLIPLGHICVSKLPELGDKKLVLQCKSGMRSSNACQKLLQENPELTLFNLDGGILAWMNANYPIEASTEKKF